MPLNDGVQGRLSPSTDGATEPWPILGEHFLKMEIHSENNLRVKQHNFYHRRRIILNKNSTWDRVAADLGGDDPTAFPLNFPWLGGNCAYVLRGHKTSIIEALKTHQSQALYTYAQESRRPRIKVQYRTLRRFMQNEEMKVKPGNTEGTVPV